MTMMCSQYYINVPLDGNTFQTTKKQQKKLAQGIYSAAECKCAKRKLPQTKEPKVLSPPNKRCENQLNENKYTTEDAGKEVPTSRFNHEISKQTCNYCTSTNTSQISNYYQDNFKQEISKCYSRVRN